MNRLRDFVDLTSDAAFAVSEDLRVLAWNQQAERVFGLASTEAVGRRCFEVVAAELPTGEPLCGPDCHGGVCFSRRVPFAVDECVVPQSGKKPVRASLSSMIVPDDSCPWHPQTCAFVFVHRLDEMDARSVMPQPLRIYTLGPFSATVNERHIAVETWGRKSALSVFKILAMRCGQVMPRDRLIEHLWPGVDEKRGRDRLKVAIHYLRQRLNTPGLIVFVNDSYVLRRDDIWVDAYAFEQYVGEGVVHARYGRLDEAIGSFGCAMKLYRGDYLEENAYDDWCAEERERLRELYFDASERLAVTLFRRNRFEEAAQTCQHAIFREPCREVFHRILMECLLVMGRSTDAEQQFRRCRQILARELSVEPLPETRRLYDRIRETRNATSRPHRND